MTMVIAIVSDFKFNQGQQKLPTYTTHQPIKICLEQTAKTAKNTSSSGSLQTRVIVKTTIEYHQLSLSFERGLTDEIGVKDS